MKASTLSWKEAGRYEHAQAGHLHCYVEELEQDAFEWFIAPDDEDKNDRRALRVGTADSRDAAITAVKEELRDLAIGLLRFTEADPLDVARRMIVERGQ